MTYVEGVSQVRIGEGRTAALLWPDGNLGNEIYVYYKDVIAGVMVDS